MVHLEFPEFFRRSEDAWFTAATVRPSVLQDVPGGLSALMREFLKHVWPAEAPSAASTGMRIPVVGGAWQWFTLVFRCFCADESALKHIYNVKGASASARACCAKTSWCDLRGTTTI